MTTVVQNFLPFHRASVAEQEKRAVLDVLESGWLTTGPRVREFEAAFAKYVNASHAVAVNSCTAALHLALAAVGVAAGDEVVIPTMTFAATGEVVCYLNAKPVLVDCASTSYHMDVDEVARAITPRTKAVIPVHYAGEACDLDAILALARQRGLKVIEDAAHALPTSYKGQVIGSIGDITCFSFYATKTLTTGEGGMATTQDADLADRMRILSLHGISRDAWKRYSAEGSWRYEILEAGYKYNLTDLQAALGLAQLQRCDSMRDERERVASLYSNALGRSDAFQVPSMRNSNSHAWHLYVIRVNEDVLRIGRDQVITELKQRGIGSSVHFIPLHLHALYRDRFGYAAGQFPNAEKLFDNSMSLPIYPDMTDNEVTRVVGALLDIARKFRR